MVFEPRAKPRSCQSCLNCTQPRCPQIFYTSFIDVIITGEGVFPFRDVIARLEKKMDLSESPGACDVGGKGKTGILSTLELKGRRKDEHKFYADKI
jgi:hypothetical protein